MTGQALRIGIDQKLVRVETVPLGRTVRPVGAVAVELTGPQSGDVTVPDVAVALRQIEPRGFRAAVLGEKAQRHLAGVLREDREIDAVAVKRRAERCRPPGGH